jgi:predicted nucleotide-binding protein
MLVSVWTDGVFRPAAGTIASLLRAVSNSDFAILVLAPEDTVISRKKKSPAPRDNCIFELGLFMGALGSDRVFIVKQRGANLKMPTDLLGITPVEFGPGDSPSLPARIAPVCTAIRQAVLGLGPK